MGNRERHIMIGTSNIVVPGNKASFPPPYNVKSRLHYYSTFFNSIEINQSFYKLPLPATFERWAGEVGDNFRFSIKLSKDITHNKTLGADLKLVDKFWYAAERLGKKDGCILVQFPGKITLDHFNEVAAILERIGSAADGKRCRIAVEFRHKSWYCGETYELLNTHQATLVLHDMPKSRVTEDLTDAAFVYLRFHGPAGDYRGTYTNAVLKQKAADIKRWARQGKEVYVYFNNTIGTAFDDAVRLQKMVKG